MKRISNQLKNQLIIESFLSPGVYESMMERINENIEDREIQDEIDYMNGDDGYGKDFDDIFQQAEEIYSEQLADSRMAGGSDPYGDAEFTKMEFLCRSIPRNLWKEYDIYDPHEAVRNQVYRDMDDDWY